MDLTTRYLGLTLRNPLVASASPLSQTVPGIRALADAGVGAVVLYSLFEEQVRRQEVEDYLLLDEHEDAFGEAQSYLPSDSVGAAADGAAPYLRHLAKATAAVDIPVIASLNGASVGGWVGIARSMESAGAAAIEINPYAVPGDLATPGSAENSCRSASPCGALTSAPDRRDGPQHGAGPAEAPSWSARGSPAGPARSS